MRITPENQNDNYKFLSTETYLWLVIWYRQNSISQYCIYFDLFEKLYFFVCGIIKIILFATMKKRKYATAAQKHKRRHKI